MLTDLVPLQPNDSRWPFWQCQTILYEDLSVWLLIILFQSTEISHTSPVLCVVDKIDWLVDLSQAANKHWFNQQQR